MSDDYEFAATSNAFGGGVRMAPMQRGLKQLIEQVRTVKSKRAMAVLAAGVVLAAVTITAGTGRT